ncbi:MAG: hypothetical protein AAFN13_11720 [Bacteroidota bacterium]
MRYWPLIASAALALSACDSGDSAETEPDPLSVKRIESLVYIEGRATVLAAVALPNRCFFPGEQEVERDGRVVRIAVLPDPGRYNRDAALCTGEEAEFLVPVSFDIAPGTYTFRLWQSANATVDTTATLP